MAIIGISITKETAFRDSIQPFSNMYFYNNGVGGDPDQAGANNLIDELVAIEKTLHSTAVEFTFGRCWRQGLTEILSVMLHQKPLTGNGTATSNAGLDRERAYLFRRRAGSDNRGQPVYLRKWYHTVGSFPGGPASLSTNITANLTGFTQAERDAMANNVGDISGLAAAGGGWAICAKSGREPTEANWQAHRYLEHHQLGDQWRGA
jgi:hypothetical protein